MRYLLDTDVVIDFLKSVQSTVDFLNLLRDRGDDLCTCTVVIAEVHSGLTATQASRAAGLLDACLFLETDADAAANAGAWRREFRKRGLALATTDVLIAATAHAHEAALVTANVADFPMKELTVAPLPRVRS